MATTPKAIHDSVVTLIRQTAVPSSTMHGGAVSFMQKSTGTPWSRAPASDIDRRFFLTIGPGAKQISYGNGTTHESQAQMMITLGHVIGNDIDAAEVRRQADANKIISTVCARANFPTDVWNIVFDGDSVRDIDGRYTLTELKFSVTYEETN